MIEIGKRQAFKLGLKYYVTQEAVGKYFDIPSWEWEKAQSEIRPRAMD